MRSESLVRFHVEQSPPRNYPNEDVRRELFDQIEEFIARGGVIEQLPNSLGTQPTYTFNRGVRRSTTTEGESDL